ncbi:soma ferritin [Episyrphus balteatus]|uniref:soma ferritin n=1 Tax=Episyrphus balteatus TaxID=286459 RepID=UPI0024850FB2|nr:soma ferritin [Episyrphus balteatus]
MKFVIALASILFLGSVASVEEGACSKATSNVCSVVNPTGNFGNCNAQYGAIPHIEHHLQSYASQQLSASYDYLLLSTFYNTYQRDRPGFSKLFRSLSDEAFENTIKLIKHVTKRGGVIPFRMHQQVKRGRVPVEDDKKTLDFDELPSLSKALDMEKELSKKAIELHAHVSVHNSQATKTVTYDPEITQFLEEEFLGKQSSNIRKLSGYANDLHKIVDRNANGGSSTALGVFLFDEYLQKQ